MGQGYCPRCNQSVMTKQNIDVCGIVIGFILGIVPGIICLIIQLTKPQDTCVICGGKVLPQGSQNQVYPQTPQAIPAQSGISSVPPVSPPQYQAAVKPSPPAPTQNTTIPPLQAEPQFCALCGEKVQKSQKFCSRCGAEIPK